MDRGKIRETFTSHLAQGLPLLGLGIASRAPGNLEGVPWGSSLEFSVEESRIVLQRLLTRRGHVAGEEQMSNVSED